MKRILLTVALLVVATISSFGQAYFSFYQLREMVPQTQSLQPAFIPKNSFTAAIPGANAGILTRSQYRLEDILSKQQGDVNFKIDFNVLLAASSELNTINSDLTSNLAYFGIKTKNGAYSLFANVRTTIDIRYNKDLMEFLANGNSNRIGGEINLENSQVVANSYQEIGIGHARTFLEKRLTVGGRVKLVTGLFHASTEKNATGTLYTDPTDYSWRITLQNAKVNTAGLDYIFNSDNYADNALTKYAMNNDNRTVAFDFGAKFKVNKWLTLEGSMNDIGTINWVEQVRNYYSADTTVTISGVQLRGLEDSSNAFKDSVQNKLRSGESQIGFSRSLPTKTYLSAAFYLSPKNRLTVMAFNNSVFQEFKPDYALAFNHSVNNFTAGLVTSYRGANNELNVGANLATDIGPVQLYVAMDNILVGNKPEQYSKFDMRFGFNLMFGYKKWKVKSEIVDLDEL